MIVSKADAKVKVAQYQELFKLIIGKPCKLSFDSHVFNDVIVHGIELGKTTGLKNAPDKRDWEGKNKSTIIFNILTDSGILTFALDDTTVTPLGNGIRLSVPLAQPLGEKREITVDLRLT